jgi:misacylated tRNA(Ala) deacylase
MHTTMHLLCAALPYYVTGGSIGFEKSRIDFDLGEETFEFETLNQIINDFIQQSHPISYQWITNEELDAQPELVRTLSVQPPRTNGQIRLVKIGTIDLQPCGGTHVANTQEIGEFKFLKYESKGKMNKRVQFTLD